VGYVDIGVTVDIAERGAFASPKIDDNFGPSIGIFLTPEDCLTFARNDIQIAIDINIGDLYIVGVSSRGSDEMLVPKINARIADRSGILVPLDSTTVGRDDIKITITINVTYL
jgi:hypothetical protein